MPDFTMTPIGTVRSTRTVPKDDRWDAETASIELDASQFSAEALAGLDAFSHLEVVYVFDRVDPSKIERGARHPRSNSAWPKVGIFAQRGKNRPNRIGTTICRIDRVDGLRLHVTGLDAIDGTPVLDIKPCMREFGPRGSVTQPSWATELMADYYTAVDARPNSVADAAFTPGFARDVALYNRWQNRHLYTLCTDLGEEARRLDRGMFFGSIHNTLNHILVVDRVMLRVAHDGTLSQLDHRGVPFQDFEQLRAERERFDAGLLTLAADHDAAWFAETVTFQRLGRERRPPRAFLLAQMFNHQTHHRSQVTSELHKLGIDYGVTDMPYNPAIAY